jgi:hypothetical protein
MHYLTVTQALTTLIAFGFGLAGHYIGDHWIQTHGQACNKALDRPGCHIPSAVWACAKHVITWSATVTGFVALAGWWLALPLRPGWLAAGMTVNAVTHFVADLRTPLIWLGRLAGRGSYIDHIQVNRGKTVEKVGPGTALFHLDQAWHIGWLAVSALLIGGPPAALVTVG